MIDGLRALELCRKTTDVYRDPHNPEGALTAPLSAARTEILHA
jgi:hypothetical protein